MAKVKAHITKKIGTNNQTQKTLLWHIAFWGLAVLLIFSPFFRGLFFPAEQYKALFLATIVFWLINLWKWRESGNYFFASALDYLVLALPVVYAISFFSSVNTGSAIDEVVKNCIYFMVFWSVSRLVSGRECAVRVITIIYLAGVGLALAGLLTATDIIDIKDGFLNGRIYSSLQYPNALASYLIASLFLGLYLWQRSEESQLEHGHQDSFQSYTYKRVITYLYSAGTYFICTALVGTKSNGGFLVFLAVLALFFLLVRGSERLKIIFHLLFTLLQSSIVAVLFIRNALEGSVAEAWMIIAAGLGTVLVFEYLNALMTKRRIWDYIWSKKAVLVAGFLVVLIAGSLIAYTYAVSNSELVSQLMSEIRLRNATERMYFYSDALEMVKERPLTGWGGGGWQEAYRLYQGYLYNSNQVHSYYMQVLVEAGTLGLTAVIAIWVFFLYISYRTYKGLVNRADKFLVWSAFAAALAIGGHAVIDFDLSLSALTMVLFALFGLINGLFIHSGVARSRKENNIKYRKNKDTLNYIPIALVTVICGFIIFVAASFASAEGDVREAGNAIRNGDVNTAVNMYISAIKNNPFKSEYEIAVSSLHARQGNIDSAIIHAETATKKEEYNSFNYGQLAELYRVSGQYDKAVENAEKAVQNAPYVDVWYEILSRNYLYYGVNLQLSGNYELAKEMLDKTLKVEERIDKQVSKLGVLEKRLWNMAPMLAPTPSIKLYSGAAMCLSGSYSEEAEGLILTAVGNEKTRAEAMFWMSVLKFKQGKQEESKQYLEKASLNMPGYRELFDKITKNIK